MAGGNRVLRNAHGRFPTSRRSASAAACRARSRIRRFNGAPNNSTLKARESACDQRPDGKSGSGSQSRRHPDAGRRREPVYFRAFSATQYSTGDNEADPRQDPLNDTARSIGVYLQERAVHDHLLDDAAGKPNKLSVRRPIIWRSRVLAPTQRSARQRCPAIRPIRSNQEPASPLTCTVVVRRCDRHRAGHFTAHGHDARRCRRMPGSTRHRVIGPRAVARKAKALRKAADNPGREPLPCPTLVERASATNTFA